MVEPKIAELMRTMLLTQHELNRHQHLEWQTQEYPWLTAMLTETAELVEQLSPIWKWWKKGDVNSISLQQIQMEVVDVWHFILSDILQQMWDEMELESFDDIPFLGTSGHKTYYFAILSIRAHPLELGPIVEFEKAIDNAQKFVSACLAEGRDPGVYLRYFFNLVSNVGLDVDTLYKKYVGKAELNKFRWANGYGDTYRKVWGEKEDNVVLSEILQTVDADATLPAKLQTELKARYEATA